MSDNFTVDPATGVSAETVFAGDDIGGVMHPRTKLEFGTDGAAVDVSASNPLPVTPDTTAVDNAAFTDGTTKVVPSGFVFDEVAGTTLTENDVAAARVDIKRAVVTTLEDATTRGQRLAISAGGAAKVDGSAVTQPTKEVRASTGTVTSTNDGTASVTLLASNANRLGASFYNDTTTSNLFIKLGAVASATSFTVKLGPSDYYEVPFNYTGIIDGIWDDDETGAVRITEIT